MRLHSECRFSLQAVNDSAHDERHDDDDEKNPGGSPAMASLPIGGGMLTCPDELKPKGATLLLIYECAGMLHALLDGQAASTERAAKAIGDLRERLGSAQVHARLADLGIEQDPCVEQAVFGAILDVIMAASGLRTLLIDQEMAAAVDRLRETRKADGLRRAQEFKQEVG